MRSRTTVDEVMQRLQSLANPQAAAGAARYGIVSKDVYGIPVPTLQKMAKSIGRDHRLAQQLWATGNLEARAIASMIDDPAQVTERQMERWVKDFDSWAICDGACSALFDKTPWAYEKAVEWSRRDPEYVKRAGYVLMAVLAVHDKAAPDQSFAAFLPHIARGAADERNFVKKGVNWALRQIGKRSLKLNRLAVQTARQIRRMDSPAARWVAADALRELTGVAVQQRLRAKTLTQRRKEAKAPRRK